MSAAPEGILNLTAITVKFKCSNVDFNIETRFISLCHYIQLT